ncbi:hypothetical protein, partial [Uniformispora flossi]|uniref:hypothetical protein n=1 Tax=Uniformispora flossi TaxID=3390723 RepID=UPI003CFCDDF0
DGVFAGEVDLARFEVVQWRGAGQGLEPPCQAAGAEAVPSLPSPLVCEPGVSLWTRATTPKTTMATMKPTEARNPLAWKGLSF